MADDEDAPTPPASPTPPMSDATKTEDPATSGAPTKEKPATGATRPAEGEATTINNNETCAGEDAPTPPTSPAVSHLKEEVSVAPAVGKSSFFAQLRAAEGRKGTVGTMHATGAVSYTHLTLPTICSV